MSQSPDYWRGAHDCCLTVKSLIRREKTVGTQRHLGEILAEIEQKAKAQGEAPRWRGVVDCIRLAQNFLRQAKPQQTLEQFLSGVQIKAEDKSGMELATMLTELNVTIDQEAITPEEDLNPLAAALGISSTESASSAPVSSPVTPQVQTPVTQPAPQPVPQPVTQPVPQPAPQPVQPTPQPSVQTPAPGEASDEEEDVLSSSLKAALQMLREEEGET